MTSLCCLDSGTIPKKVLSCRLLELPHLIAAYSSSAASISKEHCNLPAIVTAAMDKHQEPLAEYSGNGSFQYLIVNPGNGGFRDLFKYAVRGNVVSGTKFLESSEKALLASAAVDHRWVIVVSVIVRKVIGLFRKPMEWIGLLVDFFLNLLSDNGGLFGLLLNLIGGKLVIPGRGSETFISTIGHLDGRIDLYRGRNLIEDGADLVSLERIAKGGLGNRALMDLCIMASTLAYENSKVVENVVTLHWKMHFVNFYNCWNDYQKERSTQVFILCDKAEDANLILISFRGTEPFDADDWSTDFNYSWYEIPNLGKVHMGFLEAMGLGNRANTLTFLDNLQDSEEKSGSEMEEMDAYYTVRRKLKSLLSQHKNAKFVITGHSLGGALAILFPIILVLHEEVEVMQRLLGVYTFGQPRVGDSQLRRSVEAQLDFPVQRYFRVVYCNDLVPRLPYDDKTFLYKHFGVCLYYDSLYHDQITDEEPNKNFFSLRHAISTHLNAVFELVRGLTMGYVYGPEYREGWFFILFRVIGIALPGISAHCLTNYINSVRLGKESRR